MSDTILQPPVVAERLHVSLGTLAKWRVYGKGPAYVKIGRMIGYRESDLEAWIADHVVRSTSERTAA